MSMAFTQEFLRLLRSGVYFLLLYMLINNPHVSTEEGPTDSLAVELRDTLVGHFSRTRHHLVSPEYKAQTIEYIGDVFERAGLEVQRMSFYLRDDASYAGTNIIGVLPGKTKGTANDSVLVMGAHFDTVETSPGVDDNGSGMAVLIETIKLVTAGGCRLANTLVFVAFDLEERQADGEELTGSSAFVRNWLKPFLANDDGSESTLQGAIILDTLMNYNSSEQSQTLPFMTRLANRQLAAKVQARHFKGDFLAVMGRPEEDVALVAQFTDRWNDAGSALVTEAIPWQYISGGVSFKSSHISFWKNSFKAIIVTDTASLRGDMVQCYHAECDDANSITWEKMLFLAKTTRSLVNLTKELAGGEHGNESCLPADDDTSTVTSETSDVNQVSEVVTNATAAIVADLREILVGHFSENRNHLVNPKNKARTRDYISEVFEEHGLEVELMEFAVPGSKRHTGTNVIGVLPGKTNGTADDTVLVIGAHFDTVKSSPGVDDNGSGMAVLIEAIKLVTSEVCRMTNTIVFVAFDFEESLPGGEAQVGSEAFVKTWLETFLANEDGSHSTLQGAVILDSLMNYDSSDGSQRLPFKTQLEFPELYKNINARKMKGDFLAVIGRTDDDASLISGFADQWNRLANDSFHYEAVRLPFSEIAMYTHGFLKDVFRSDHAPFWRQEPNPLSAILLTDTGNLRGNMTLCYHSECDDISAVTEEKMLFLAKTTRTVAYLVKEFGGHDHVGECSVRIRTGMSVSGCPPKHIDQIGFVAFLATVVIVCMLKTTLW